MQDSEYGMRGTQRGCGSQDFTILFSVRSKLQEGLLWKKKDTQFRNEGTEILGMENFPPESRERNNEERLARISSACVPEKLCSQIECFPFIGSLFP